MKREANFARDLREKRDWPDGRGLIWFIWSVRFIWLVSFNQTHQKDQINKRDPPVFALRAPRSLPLADFFSILLVFRSSGFVCQMEDFRLDQVSISP